MSDKFTEENIQAVVRRFIDPDYPYNGEGAKLAAEARLFAELDGCEGGDYWNALAGTLELSHYSYTGDDGAGFMAEVRRELAVFDELVHNPEERIYSGLDNTDYVELYLAALDEIRKI